jgi:hypothetical protein
MTKRFLVAFCFVASLWAPVVVASPAVVAGDGAWEIWAMVQSEVRGAVQAITRWLSAGFVAQRNLAVVQGENWPGEPEPDPEANLVPQLEPGG